MNSFSNWNIELITFFWRRFAPMMVVLDEQLERTKIREVSVRIEVFRDEPIVFLVEYNHKHELESSTN